MNGDNRVTTRLEWVIPCRALGKPRMTRRDKWAQRDCVVEFREYKDYLKAAMIQWPEPEQVQLMVIEARYLPPPSWSQKKQREALGTLKRTAPDPDNIEKGIYDALWGQDQAVGDTMVRRRWWHEDQLIIRMYLDEAILLESGKL